MSEKEETIRMRSPRCPSMSLGSAIAKAELIYTKNQRHEIPADIMAQHMGYTNSKTGPAAQALASLAYYNLVVRTNQGKLCVTKTFEDYKYAPEERIKKVSLRQWLLSPTVFRELLEKFSTGLPSDATLKFEFIQRGFNANKADDHVRIFRESVEFAGFFTSSLDDQSAQDTTTGEDSTPLTTSNTIQPPTQADADQIPIRLSGGRKAYLTIPNPFYAKDKEIIKSFVDLLYTEE